MDAPSSVPMMRASDVQAILRLVAGAAELWYEPTLQRQFTLDSLCRIFEARAGICFTLGDVLLGGSEPCAQIAFAGLDETAPAGARARAMFEDYLRTGRPRDPMIEHLRQDDVRVRALRRRDCIPEDQWTRCEHFQQLYKPLGLGPALYIRIWAQSIARETIVTVCRGEEAEPFAPRDLYLAELCLSEMAWPFTPDLRYTDPAVEKLQPRLRKVMKLLLEGDSEKQVAYKLKLSPHTVHEYVKDLYSELRVSSRGELLAQFVGKA